LENDGSVALAPLPGHTTGSTGVFVNLRSGKRYLFTGDLTWALEGFKLPAERPSESLPWVCIHGGQMLKRKSPLLNCLGSVLNAILLSPLLLLSSFAPALAQAPTFGEAPKAPPYQWPRSHNYDVLHYRIKLAFDWAAKSVTGATTITLKPLAGDFKEIELD